MTNQMIMILIKTKYLNKIANKKWNLSLEIKFIKLEVINFIKKIKKMK